MNHIQPWETESGTWYPLEPIDRTRLSLAEFAPLVIEARKARENAYAPYSRFRVGASVLMEQTRYWGCNVENASYGATICAERNAVFQGVANGHRFLEVLALSTSAPTGSSVEARSPCGMCRQVISEFSGENTLILLDRGGTVDDPVEAEMIRLASLIPYRFRLGPDPGIDS